MSAAAGNGVTETEPYSSARRGSVELDDVF